MSEKSNKINAFIKLCCLCQEKSTFIKNKELSNALFEINRIINKFLLTGDTFMSELHLKQPGFTYSDCGSLTKHRERIQKFRETGNLKDLYRIELDKAWFALDSAYSDSKDLAQETISDKILKHRAFEIARNRRYDGYQRASMV